MEETNSKTTDEVTEQKLEPKEEEKSDKDLEEKKSDPVVEPKTKKKKNKIGIIIAIICIIIFILGVVGVIYFKFSRDNKRIISTGITNLTAKFEDMTVRNEDVELTKNYTIDGNIKLDLESDLLDQYSSVYEEYKPYVNLINNLKETDNNFSLKQNLDSKKILYKINSKLNNEDLIDAKFYLEEDKEYYFVKGFLDKYIENGDSNYLETLEENQNTYDNIDYLYKFIVKSLKENLKDDYFVKTSQAITIDGKKINTKKITMKLDDKNGNELLENILKDLKADKKANEILTSLDENFEDVEVKDAFEENQKITFSVYVDNIFYHIKKYELTVDDSYEEVLISYIDQEKDIIEIYDDNELVSSVEITNKNKDNYTFNIFDDDHEKMATISLKNTKELVEASFNIDIDDYVVDGKITSKYSNIVKNKSYDNNTIISVNVKVDDEDVANVKITMDMKAKNDSDIDEDISNAIKQEEITTDQQQSLQTMLTNALIKLMS